MPDRPVVGEVEQRTALDAPAPVVQGRRLHGLIPYSVESRDLGGYREVIEPGALADADISDLIATREHDRSKLLGRHPTTLTTEDRADGFAWSVELPQSPVGEDVRVAIERGDLRATSWRMVVGRDRWEGGVRHVEAIAELRDVCVTAASAYGNSAPAEYRSAPEPSPAPERAPAVQPEEEAPVPPEDPPKGGLRVEDRTATPAADEPSVESRVLDAIRSVRPGEVRALTTATTSARPVTPPELSTLLWDMLRPTSVLLASGARVITTLAERVIWPRITASVNPTWVAEAQVIPAGDPAFGSMEAVPKKLAHRTVVSNEVIDDSDPSITAILNAHLAQMLALKFDLAAFEGNPAADANSIRGLRFTPGIQTLSMGTNGGALANYDAFVRAVAMLRAANVPPPYAIAAHPNVLLGLELLKTRTDSNEQLGAPVGLPPFFTTPQLSSTETKGTASNASSAYVYAPNEIVVVRRMDSVIELDRSRLFDSDQSEFRAKMRVDVIVPNAQSIVRVDGIVPAA